MPFRGTVPAGETCAFDAECESGSCIVPACTETCCAGTCHTVAAAAIGEACEVDVDCTGDAFCGRDLVCHGLGATGTNCERDDECDFGLACVGSGPGSCRAQPHLGEPCPFFRCGDLGAACIAGTCVVPGLPGAPCASANDCSRFAQCDTTAKRCIAVPTLGQPCQVGCAGEAWCDLDNTHVCSTPKPDTTMCDISLECASLFCEEGVEFAECAERPLCL